MQENPDLPDYDDFDQYIEGLLSGKKPSEKTIAKICAKAKEVLSEEPNAVSVRAPTTICGSLCGQFEDLLEVFRLVGKPPDTNFVFLGDYFFKGSHGVETLSLLLALKVRYKNRVILLRGRAEDSNTAEYYGLRFECEQKYGNNNVWKLFTDVFNSFPFCAVIDSHLFCTSGGLAPNLITLNHIQEINRYEYSQSDKDPTAAMIWSEPGDNEGWGPSNRGLGYCFPKKATKMFLHYNNFKMIILPFRIEKEGYSYTHDNMVLKLGSAPSFLWNKPGALVEVDEYGETKILQFETAKKAEYVFKGVNYFERKNLVRLSQEEI